MIESDFFIEPASWDVDEDRIKPVRTEVFITEQAVPDEDEWDDQDRVSQHFLACAESGAVIGTARLSPGGQIGRIAVVEAWRGRGVGAAMLRSAVEAASLRGLTKVTLAAQVHAIEFYVRAGFEPYGEVFDDAGIPHRWMRLDLATPDPVQDQRPRRALAPLPGKQVVEFENADGYRRELLRLLSACENRLALYTHDLEPRITDQQPLIDAFTALATGAGRPDIRILVQDARAAARNGHRLIDLAQRLPSVLAFRRPAKDDLDYPSAFAIADRAHVLFRSRAERFEGELRIGHRREVKLLLEYFDRVWEEGRLDPNLRRLDL